MRIRLLLVVFALLPVAAQAQGNQATLSGLVVGAGGECLGEAMLQIIEPAYARGRIAIQKSNLPGPCYWNPNGFEFSDMTPGLTVAVRVWAPDYETGLFFLTPSVPRVSVYIEMTRVRHAFVYGLVLDDKENCIEGATVEIVAGQGMGRSMTQMPCTWDDGGFRFGDLVPGIALTLRGSVSGHPAQEKTVMPSVHPETPHMIIPDIFFYFPDKDPDSDGLPSSWEVRFDLDPDSPEGDDGASGDPDHDGKTNLQEHQANTHPRGLFTRYFAEGVTSDFFDLRAAFLNPNATVARVLVHFQTTGTTEHHAFEVPSNAIRTLNPKMLPRMNRAEFSMVIESDQPLVADRTITWDAAAYGGHAETSIAEPALRWYLAEGSTVAGFNLFYLLQNPHPSAARVLVRYLRPAPPPAPGPWSDFATAAPLEKVYDLPPNSRSNIWVNVEDFPGLGRVLAASDVSAAIEVIDGPPIVVERAMYLDAPGQVFGAAHQSVGVTAPATQWFLAEGATGPFFDLYVLAANPGDADAQVEATYLLPDGIEVKKPYTIAAGSRFNIHVDLEDPQLANTAVSTTVRSVNDVPIVVERAMWWPDGRWYEGHSSPGSTSTGTRWALAEGEVGGARDVDTYILVANTSGTTGSVKVSLLFEDGTSIDKVFTVTARSRLDVDVRDQFPAALNKRFGALIESVGSTPAQLVVERSMYWNAVGQQGRARAEYWAAGTNVLATRLQ